MMIVAWPPLGWTPKTILDHPTCSAFKHTPYRRPPGPSTQDISSASVPSLSIMRRAMPPTLCVRRDTLPAACAPRTQSARRSNAPPTGCSRTHAASDRSVPLTTTVPPGAATPALVSPSSSRANLATKTRIAPAVPARGCSVARGSMD